MLASTLADFVSLVIKQVIQNQETLETEIDTDLIMCSTTSWVQSLEESKSVFQKPEQYSTTVLIKVSCGFVSIEHITYSEANLLVHFLSHAPLFL